MTEFLINKRTSNKSMSLSKVLIKFYTFIDAVSDAFNGINSTIYVYG